MAINTSRFVSGAKRLTALELVKGQNADAWSAWRQEADLFGDHQRIRINLSTSDLSGLNISKFNLTNVSFYRANIRHSKLVEADCAYTDFHEAQLIGADFTRASLRFARLSRAYLREAVLDYADLRGADLRRASVRGASFIGTDLRGVDLSSTRGLDQEQLIDAIGDTRTRLPTHLEHPAHWDNFEDEPQKDDEDLENLRIIPASVEVAVVSGLVQLSRKPGDAYFSSSADPATLKSEILADLAELSPRCGNLPSLQRAIKQYVEELQKEDYDIILVGTRAIRIESIFNSVISTDDPEGAPLLADAVGLMRAILIQHYLFVGQSHRWKSFVAEAAIAPYSNEDVENTRKVGSQIIEILNDHSQVCEPRVPKAIEIVTEEIEIGDDRQKLAVFNALASVENVFRSVVTWLVKESKRLLGVAWSSFKSKLSEVIGSAMTQFIYALILSPIANALATKYPERFAWLLHAMELLKNAMQ